MDNCTMKTLRWHFAASVYLLVSMGCDTDDFASESVAPPAKNENTIQAEKSSKIDMEAIVTLLTAYESTAFAERGQFVVDPEEFERQRRFYYKNADENQVAAFRSVKVVSVRDCPTAGHFAVEIRRVFEGDQGTPATITYVTQTDDGLKIDWAATTGFNPIGFAAWAAGKDEEVVLRVTAQIGDYYTPEYRHVTDLFYAIRCEETFGDHSFAFTAYLGKSNKNLYDILKDGHKHELTLRLKRGPFSRDAAIAADVKEMVSESWGQ